ncbi:hypothetical protein BDP27DRAFT_1450363 [Rhodocollybia butyracea]|uniref:Uncharacterized protein n=1 Tax=Rhodocollybia butyracea TaxID=206335 RepID=A0A9P5PNI5_9AGAR|nr:hypothetical protein BDP27DRAFT_1450363 [Rhodocollybia butyracea]
MTITALPTCSPKIKGKRDNLKNQSRIFQVESTLFEVNAAKLCEVSPAIKKIVSKNMETHSPIVLHGHTSQKFENFLWALSVDSIPPPLNEKTLERLLDVEELSKRYSVRELQVRTESDLLATITEGTNPAILACSSRSLVRMLQIVLRVHNNTLFSFLIQMWAWR